MIKFAIASLLYFFVCGLEEPTPQATGDSFLIIANASFLATDLGLEGEGMFNHCKRWIKALLLQNGVTQDSLEEIRIPSLPVFLLNSRYFPFSLQELQKLLEDPKIMYIEHDVKINIATPKQSSRSQTSSPMNIQSDVRSWGLDRIDQQELPLDNQYSYSEDGQGADTIVYVVDTGVDVRHPELEGRAKWGKTVIRGSPDFDDNGHGTFVAGVVGSKTYGAAKQVDIIAVKALDIQGEGNISDILRGVEWCISNHASQTSNRTGILNLSLGTSGFSRALNDAMESAHRVGLLVIAAAGNENNNACNTSPASSPLVISVGATDVKDQLADFSNWGTCVALLAPGKNITSIWPSSRTSMLSGTSFAAPFVAGTAVSFLSMLDFISDIHFDA